LVVEQADAGAVEEQHLDRVPPLAEEHEQGAAAGLPPQPLGDHACQPVESPAQVDEVERDEDLDAMRDH